MKKITLLLILGVSLALAVPIREIIYEKMVVGAIMGVFIVFLGILIAAIKSFFKR